MNSTTYWVPLSYALALFPIKFLWVRQQHGALKATFKWLAEPLMWGWLLTVGLTDQFAWNMALGYVVGLVIVLAVDKMFKVRKPSKTVLRGTEIIQTEQAIQWQKSDPDFPANCHARIGKIPIPIDVETVGFLFAGAPGSGKSLAFLQLMGSARARKQAAVVADLGGEFAAVFYRKDRDIMLNPFDKRGKAWSPFAEMREPLDAVRIAASMIPEGFGAAKEWNGYARAILEVVLEILYRSDRATNAALCYYCLGAKSAEMLEFCEGTTAASNFEPGNERLLGSIKTVMSNFIRPYTYLAPEVGIDAFSIRKFVETNADAWLFLSYLV